MQTIADIIGIHIVYDYTHPQTGAHVHVSQHGRLIPQSVVEEHQRDARRNTANHDVNIPCWKLHTQRMEDGILKTPSQPLDYAFIHLNTMHHDARVERMEWRITINGVTYKESDRKRNYERRVRDLKNACRRFLEGWEE